METPNCALCAVVTKALSLRLTRQLLDYAKDEKHTLEVLLYLRDEEGAFDFSFRSIGLDGIAMKMPQSISRIFYAPRDFVLRIASQDLRKSSVFNQFMPAKSARILKNSSCDITSMKHHLQTCIDHHGETCERTRHTMRLLPGSASDLHRLPINLRFIDVENDQVVSAPTNCSYVALSYVWVQSKEARPTTLTTTSLRAFREPQGLPMSRLPQTILDAITVCQKLGERYLWVDASCIIQDDEEDRAAQIAEMDKIYSLAKVTLVAACGKDPSQGLSCLRFRDPPQATCEIDGISYVACETSVRQSLHQTPWHSRGWTYQEFILSRRLIFFTSFQVFYMCAAGTCTEDTTYHDPENLHKSDSGTRYDSDIRRHPSEWDLVSIGIEGSAWKLYNEIIESYTKRQLTYQTDTLFAISGILKVFSRYCDDTFIYGIPVKLFNCALLWQPLGALQRNHMWPSWSWAGWTGAVCNLATDAIHWTTRGNVFVSALQNLTFSMPTGAETAIERLELDTVKPWFLYEYGLDPTPTLMERKPDKPFLEGRYLNFESRAIFLSIIPVPRDKASFSSSSRASSLHKYHIFDGDNWVGTMLLSQEYAASYPTALHQCEFIQISNCNVAIDQMNNEIFNNIFDASSSRKHPDVFDQKFFQWARDVNNFQIQERLREASRRDKSAEGAGISDSNANDGLQASPARIWISHVMRIERKDGIAYRIAIGVIHQFSLKWYDVKITLG